MPATTIIVAHQGGWDEILIFAIPLLLYGGLRLYDRYRGNDEDPDAGADGEQGTVSEHQEPRPADE